MPADGVPRRATGHVDQEGLLLHADLQHLIQLQELDSTADRLRRRLADFPTIIAALDERLAARTAASSAVKERIATSQANRRDIEKDLTALQARLSKFKGQLMEVKTNKEYQAMQHEIQTAEEGVRGQEDRMLDQMEEAETLASELKAAETALREEQAAIAQEKKAIESEGATLQQELEKNTAERASAAAHVSKPALALFESVAKHRRGVALSEAKDGLCSQCHVRLRPQMFNEVRRNDALHQCDSCSRILYYVPVSTPDAAPSA